MQVFATAGSVTVYYFPGLDTGCLPSLPHVLMGIGACRVDAGKVELDGAQYLGFRIPLTISQLVWIEAILVGGAEIYRNRERDPETRLYPGKQSLQIGCFLLAQKPSTLVHGVVLP